LPRQQHTQLAGLSCAVGWWRRWELNPTRDSCVHACAQPCAHWQPCCAYADSWHSVACMAQVALS
ncbi:MAG: hypothetical protein ACK55I_05060, partial [bacterium]